jgi:large subunit ribosomal protein LP0
MHQIRVALRGKGVVLMGKNTMVRRALRSILAEYPQYERLLPYVKGNIGFVFTDEDLKEIREIIVANKVAAPARAGAFAPKDVTVPAGNTGMEPGKTSFFQALGVPTKIARGTIEIVSDVKVVVAGTRVGTSEATLLNMLNISPFTYGMTVVQIFDQGNIFSPDVLDIDENELIDRFLSGIKTVAAISLALNYPTIVSVTHTLVNAYKNLIAISLATEYTFEGSEKVRVFFVGLWYSLHDLILNTLKIRSVSRGALSISFLSDFYDDSYPPLTIICSSLNVQVKEYLANPDAFASAAPVEEAAPVAAAAVEEKEPEKEEESDEDMVCVPSVIPVCSRSGLTPIIGLRSIRLEGFPELRIVYLNVLLCCTDENNDFLILRMHL